MRTYLFRIFTIALITFYFSGCKKQTEQLLSPPISDYLPLQIGKYIIYRTDSTVFTNFGTVTEIHSYEEKQLVDTIVTDGLGRTAYRIYTFLRDTAETQPWVATDTYIITPLIKSAEVIENNLRMVKLSLPINKDFSWKGNNYLPDNAFSGYDFGNDDDINNWPYTYGDTDTSIVLNGLPINHVLVVNGINEETNVPIVDPKGYSFLNFQQEYYAKGIGLVSQELTMWEYQPPKSGSGSGFKIGFGIKRTMLNHN